MAKIFIITFLSLTLYALNLFAADKDLNEATNDHLSHAQVISLDSHEYLTMNTFDGQTVTVKKYFLERPYPLFQNTDEAALSFVDFLNQNFDITQVEYCAIFEKYENSVTLRNIYRGTANSCPTQGEVFTNPVASIHTHPGEYEEAPDLSLPIQVPSYADYAIAVARDHPQYMAGPAGQILKYTRDDIQCRGRPPHLLIKLTFEELRPAKKTSRHQYSIGESFQLLDKYGESFIPWLCPHL